MWLMLSRFYPPDQITFAYAVIESGITLSHTIAGPLAASILALDGLGGLQGWQWLFFLEGLPSVLLALAMWRLLPNSPAQVCLKLALTMLTLLAARRA
ncbi:uncharacterized protein HaLaN_22344 [Haematococcus lacustris]|uniref:Major facilitator superfamily (MFS) profile domain-containing protein n=1 Tax=Haematococcus lacustris TaxID=44745 RepID=A0A6A0A3N9_HAELA|nr:uncharacterized protein HaLaN_22344 [Haematococcus lacustris]